MKKQLALWLTFLKIGAFTFGGGYAMLALLEHELIDRKHWLTRQEFLDMIAISESTPRPHCHQQRNLYWQEDEWIFWRGSCDDRCDRTIVSHHYSHCFIPGDGGRKSLYPGCVCWDKSSGLRVDPDFCGQAGQTDPERTVSMDPGCCSFSCHRRVWDHCCMGSPSRCCDRYFI